MATTRTASAHWEGSLMEGSGEVTLESSGIGTYAVTWPSRAEEPPRQTSPEELIAAAHSTCFSMALSHGLAQAGTPPTSIDTTANVTFQPGPASPDRPVRHGDPSRHHRRAVRGGRAGRQGGLPGQPGPRGGPDHAGGQLQGLARLRRAGDR